MPVNVEVLEAELKAANYDHNEIEYLCQGFRQGFHIGYTGPKERKSKSRNIPLTIGSPTILWNKIIKEVKANRVAGPFDDIPYKNFIQSPVGLVPKAGSMEQETEKQMEQ